jgi:hypothetical protein
MMDVPDSSTSHVRAHDDIHGAEDGPYIAKTATHWAKEAVGPWDLLGAHVCGPQAHSLDAATPGDDAS